jgi:hypothetical protein
MQCIPFLAGVTAEAKRRPGSSKIEVSQENEALQEPQLAAHRFPKGCLTIQV